jgi:cobalt-zinc-cadmium efflux system membrane fusion protein
MKNYIIISLLFLAACAAPKTEEKKAETHAEITAAQLSPLQIKNAAIVCGMAESKSVSSIVKLNGVIEVPPQNMVSVSFPLGGYLKSTKLLPGLHVNKGEVLAVLEDAQFIQLQQDYLMAKSKLEFIEAEYNRQKELNASKATSDKVYQQAKAEVENQRILLRSLSEKLMLISINPNTLSANSISRSVNLYSPINGFVSQVNVNIGKYTSPTDVLFELVNPEDIHLNLMVFEKDVAKLSIGQKVMAFTNDKPDEMHEAEIILISKNLNENRAAEVHCHFEEYDKTLLPGMYMNAEVEVKLQNVLTVPNDAVLRWQNKYYVFSDKGNGNFELCKVKLGVSENGFQEITAEGNVDLKTQKLVLKNAYSILMQMKNSSEE